MVFDARKITNSASSGKEFDTKTFVFGANNGKVSALDYDQNRLVQLQLLLSAAHKIHKACSTGVHNSSNSLLTQILRPFWEVHHPTVSQILKETRVSKTIDVKSRMQGSSDQRSLDVLCSTKITEWSSLGVLWSTDSVPSTLISRTMRHLAPPRTREKHHSTPPQPPWICITPQVVIFRVSPLRFDWI